MKKRLITTFAALLVLFFGFRFVPHFFEILLPVVLCLSAFEATQLFWLGCLAEDQKPLCVFGRTYMVIAILTGYLAWVGLQSTVASLGTVAIFFWLILFLRKKQAKSFSRTFTLLGVLGMYLLVPFVLMWEIYRSFGIEVVLFILVPVWFADTGAYLVGKAVGKTLLAPAVSPGKTWEGFVGGLVIGALSALVFYRYAGAELTAALGQMSVWSILVWGLVVSVLGQLGDLMQSNLKRASGIKDSGSILPGHGGMLDRIDSTLMVVPVFALALSFFG